MEYTEVTSTFFINKRKEKTTVPSVVLPIVLKLWTLRPWIYHLSSTIIIIITLHMKVFLMKTTFEVSNLIISLVKFGRRYLMIPSQLQNWIHIKWQKGTCRNSKLLFCLKNCNILRLYTSNIYQKRFEEWNGIDTL